jgi:hypothetical protein
MSFSRCHIRVCISCWECPRWILGPLDDHLHGGVNDLSWMEGFVVPFLLPDRAVIVGLLCGVLAGYIYIHINELFVCFCIKGFGFARPECSDPLIWVSPHVKSRLTSGVFLEHWNN